MQFFENKVAKYNTKAGFAISEGWNCNGPITSHLFASFTVTPNGENLTNARVISTKKAVTKAKAIGAPKKVSSSNKAKKIKKI